MDTWVVINAGWYKMTRHEYDYHEDTRQRAASADDLRSFQIHQHERGASASKINGAVSALRFFCGVTLKRQHLASSLIATRRPHRMARGTERRDGRTVGQTWAPHYGL
jgi:site-specific recombinase XerC